MGCFQGLGVPFGGPHDKDYSMSGSILGSPYFGKLRLEYCQQKGTFAMRTKAAFIHTFSHVMFARVYLWDLSGGFLRPGSVLGSLRSKAQEPYENEKMGGKTLKRRTLCKYHQIPTYPVYPSLK